MSSHIDLGPIGRVSPLIKLTRWTALTLGVIYGYKRYNANKATEDEIRAYNARMKPIWDLEKAQLNAKNNREQLLKLAQEAGVTVSHEMHESVHNDLLKQCPVCHKKH